MKNSKKALSIMMTSALVFTSTPHHFIVNALTQYQPGVTVEKNSTGKSDADYQATFVYEDKDEKDAVDVTVSGNLQFYSYDDPAVQNFIKTGDASKAKVYDVFNYKDGMFNTGYGLNGDSQSYKLTEVEDEKFEVTLPVPGNLYYYDYTVTYADGSKVTIQDPANPSPKNDFSGHDSGHSLVYVGDTNNTTKGQEKIYARNDQKGSYSFKTYTATDGTKQPLGIYLPNGYDTSKVYKTIYVSHGGGGNEAEWMGIGSVPNIMDNLMAEGEVADAVVVTMDNTYFKWDYDTIAKNLKENIIPYVEENYSVSKNVKDRALCGLSMGSMTTSTIMQSYTDLFSYYGCFSGANVGATVKDVDLLKDVTIYLTAGNVDMALMNDSYGKENDRTTNGLRDKLDQLGVNYTFDTKGGAHDWGVWRDELTTFAKNFLWDAQDLTLKYQPGVTVEKNTQFKDVKDSAYQATFVYEDDDEKDAVSVSVAGNLQFYKHDDVTDNFIKTGDASKAKVYNVYEYENGMFNTGYGLNGDSQSYELNEVRDERFEITLPVPGNLYYYDYTVTYADGSTKTIQDPVNHSETNPFSGHDSGHSLVYVGDASNTTKGQEEIYARTDGKTGVHSFVEYQAVDGTTQPLGVYLPNGYDSSKTYKTIYVSHGGGGNEAEWMGIGAIPNIMDNLIAEGEVADAIVVTMDNTYFKWDYDTIAKNLKENIIPYVEENYSVSKNVKDRALCGLSMGSMTTSTILQEYTDMFGSYGCFSGANMAAEIKDVEALKNVNIYLTAGNVDMALKATTDEGDVGNPGKTVGLARTLDELGVKYGMDVKDGAHDWGVWRAAFTTFVKDYLWDVETKDNPVEDKKDTTTPSQDTQNKINTSVSNKKENTQKVKTGDQTQISTYMMALFVGLIGMLALVIKRKKETL